MIGLRGWCKISGPIKEHTLVKPSQSWITFDTQFKIALFRRVPCFSFEVYVMSLKGDSGFNSHLKSKFKEFLAHLNKHG